MAAPPRTTSRPPPSPEPELASIDPRDLNLVLYPDPRLRRRAREVQSFDERARPVLAGLAVRMLEVMRQHKGVGLAAPQVGVLVRIFVMNSTGEPGDDRVYINPRLSEAEGEQEHDEGCLSLPEINTPVLRSGRLRIQARDLEGHAIDETADGLVARVWQHEIDHLDGVLILDKMPATVKMAHRRKLKALEDAYREAHPGAAAPRQRQRRRK